jgi:hypothetical protein
MSEVLQTTETESSPLIKNFGPKTLWTSINQRYAGKGISRQKELCILVPLYVIIFHFLCEP